MTALNTFRNGAYESYQSDVEILRAIEVVSGREMPRDSDGETGSDAYRNEAERIWADPTPEEQAAVEAEAWKLADVDEERLSWGQLTLTRAEAA